MTFDPSVEGLLSLLYALPLVLLGALLPALRPRRPENAFFAAFAIGWGLQVIAANLSRLTSDSSLHDVFFLASVALTLPTAFLLAYFASVHPRRNVVARNPFGASLLLLAVLPGLSVLLLRPELVVQRTVAVGGRPLTVYGEWFVPLVAAPFFGAFYYALAVQVLAARRETIGIGAQRARFVALALAPFVAYVSSRQFAFWTWPTPPFDAQTAFVRIANATLFGAGLLMVLTLAAVMAFRPARPKDRDRGLIVALVVPAGVGVAERVLREFGANVETLALWRFLAVALVAYAVARYQLFELDLRLRRAAVRSLPWAVASAVLALVVSLVLAGMAWWVLGASGIAGTVLATGVWQRRHAIADALVPDGSTEHAYLQHRKLEVYRAELENILTTGMTARADDARLRRLRSELGLSEREHEVLEFVARESLGRAGAPHERPLRVEPGALLFERYRVERLIGEGAHGRAYLAYDERSRRRVVMKTVGTTIFDARAASLLRHEARIVQTLTHPNIVKIEAVHESALETLLVMEYCEGGSLQSLIERRGRLSLAEAQMILGEILAALEAAHGRGVVHRDLKPGNILLHASGAVRLADFGIAREARSDATVGATQAGVLGTLLYMSPEQVRGRGVDARSDLYAAGVLYHQMLTGGFYLRIAGRDDFQIRQRILTTAPRLGGVPDAVAGFLQRALAKDPNQRFQSAAEMRAALRGRVPAPRKARPVPAASERRRTARA